MYNMHSITCISLLVYQYACLWYGLSLFSEMGMKTEKCQSKGEDKWRGRDGDFLPIYPPREKVN